MNSFIRKLGLAESLYVALHDHGAMIDVNFVRIRGQIHPDVIRTALDLLQQRHPLLQAHLQESEDGIYFCSEATLAIPLRILDRQSDQSDQLGSNQSGLEIAEAEIHTKFDGGLEPLCRVTFLPASEPEGMSELIATFHHAIVDGISCMHFINELLSHCQQLINLQSPQPAEMVTMPVLPPLEGLLEHCLSQRSTELLDSESAPVVLSQPGRSPTLLIEQDAQPDQRYTCLLVRRFNADLTSMLKLRCRAEQTTMHGALSAALVIATADMTVGSDVATIAVSCGNSVNLRSFCHPPVEPNYLGCFVSTVTAIHPISPDTDFWELARDCRSKIHYAIEQKIPHTQANNAEILKHYRPPFLAQTAERNMGRINTTHISNRGQFNFPDSYGTFSLEELYFATGQHLVGACFWLGVLTFHNQMFCTFSHVVPLISKNTASKLADSVMMALQRAI
jgi:hypothetical protein